jgi:Cd2+/Zn2+-exporting ATPase
MTNAQKNVVYRLIAALVLYISALLIPLQGVWSLIAYLPSYLVIGYDVLWSAGRNIARGRVFDENFLMALATVGALAIKEYPEAVAVMLFYQIGELFQDIAVGKSRKSIAALMDIRPESAVVIRDGAEIRVWPEEVEIGEAIIIRPGEKIPLDGVILSGSTTINTSALTGESLPADKEVGDSVISGTLNLSGVIRVEVKSSYENSTVAKILELVENSAVKKAQSERFITRFSRYYTPCVVIAAVLLAFIPPLILKQSITEWLNRALIFLVVSCPCALVISVPLSFFGGIGGASRRGILIKGANYIEALAKTDIVVFDKTGTLTKGSFTVSAIHPAGISEASLLELAAAAESYSNHPIADSIIKAYGGKLDKSRVTSVTELPGHGIRAEIDGKTVLAGNDKLMRQFGISFTGPSEVGTAVHITADNEYRGYIVISDTVKPDAGKAVEALKNLGVSKTVILTGDAKRVGEEVGLKLNVDEVHTELLPDQKVLEVERLLGSKNSNKTLVFVGDGVNDAPVLARADVGIAMGTLGSQAAIEAADVVLTDDRPLKIAEAVSLSRKTLSIVRQNISFALTVKAVILVLSAVGHANMWLAVFADVGVMVLAIMNAMRTLNRQRPA